MDFFFLFFGNLFRFFSRVLFPFAYLFKSSLPVIVLLSHEMLAGFLSNKGRNLIGKEQWVNGKIGSGFFRQMLLVFVCNFQNWSKFTYYTRCRWKALSSQERISPFILS